MREVPRGPHLWLLLPTSRGRVMVTMVLVVLLLLLQSRGVQGEGLDDVSTVVRVVHVHCGCGNNLSRVLVVEASSERECLAGKQRRPPKVGGEGEREGESGGSRTTWPLRTRVRRSSEGSEILLSWNLRYLRRKRSLLSDFHLFFGTKSHRKGRKQWGGDQCFRVTGLQKICKKKVTCKARTMTRIRGRNGLALQVIYQYGPSGQQPADGVIGLDASGQREVSYVLKAELGRRAKRRGAKRNRSGQRKKQKRPRKEKRSHRRRLQHQQRRSRRREASSCETWFPKVTLSSERDRVAVTISPVNPFASELELALCLVGNKAKISPTHVLANVSRYTFTNVTEGTYRLRVLALGIQCFQAKYIFSTESIHVKGNSGDNSDNSN